MTDGSLTMALPTPNDLSHIVLHSPSHIIGTPFSTSSTRFEYPFPDCSSAGSTSSPINGSPASSQSTSTSTSTASTSRGSHCSFGSVSFSFNLPLSLPPSAQFRRSITLVPPGGQNHNHHNCNHRHHNHHHNHPSPTHPKLRLQTAPPIPPTLITKRNLWNLAYLGLKKDASPLDDGATSDASAASDRS